MSELINQSVRHKGNGKSYRITSLCKLKIGNAWYDAIIYEPLYKCDPGFETCVRIVEDFWNNFEVDNGKL